MKNKQMHLRLSALLLAMLMFVSVFSGCGREEETPQVSLRTMSILGDEATKDAYTALLEDYSARYPHVYHMGTLSETSNAYKLDATFESTYTASRYPHAVYYYTDTGIMELSNQFVSVEEIRITYPDFAAGVPEAVLDTVRAEDGKAYCVPFAGSWTALAVNTTMLETYSLQPPRSWQELITAAGILSARGITAIANSPDDSAALLELICLGMDGEKALDSILSNEPRSSERHRETWLDVFRMYQELCGINSFPPAATDDELVAALEQLALVEAYKAAQTVSSGDVSGSDVSGTDASLQLVVSPADIPLQTVRADAMELFNSGQAAMIIIDSGSIGRIAREDYVLVAFPDCSDTGSDGKRTLVGGYDTGWFITRRAFNDKAVCDAVVAFVDAMTGGSACDSFAQLGYLPCVVSTGDVSAGLYGMVSDADCFAATRIAPSNSTRYAALEDIAAALSMDIITPEQAVDMVFDPALQLTDMIEQPPELPQPETPQPPASDSDI